MWMRGPRGKPISASSLMRIASQATPHTAAITAATAPTSTDDRGPNTSAIQPMIGAPIGVPPVSTAM